MAFTWVREDTPVWDAAKRSIVGGAPDGALDVPKCAVGDLAPGEWFRVEENGVTLGFGWMDCTWGDAEITIAVDPGRTGEGVGGFIVSQLEREASARGLNYLYNAVRPAHPEKDKVTRWLLGLGFKPSGDGLLKKGLHPASPSRPGPSA